MSNLQELSAVKLVDPLVEYQSDPLNPARGVSLKNCHVYTSAAGAYILWDKYDSYALPFDPFTNKFLESAVTIDSFQVGGTILIWETEELQGDAPRKYVIEGIQAYANPQEVQSTMGQATIRITLALGSSEDIEVLTRVSEEGPDFEHLTHNENFDYYFTDLVSSEPSSWDSPIPYSSSPVKFSPEEFLKRQYPGYAWVTNRNLVVIHEQSNGLAFVTPDINTEAKFLRIRTFGPTKANAGIKEIAQLGTSKYFYIEKPTAVTAAGAKYPMYAYIANLDEFFSYDWMFLEALHAIDPEVLFHFKFYDRLKYGRKYDANYSNWLYTDLSDLHAYDEFNAFRFESNFSLNQLADTPPAFYNLKLEDDSFFYFDDLGDGIRQVSYKSTTPIYNVKPGEQAVNMIYFSNDFAINPSSFPNPFTYHTFVFEDGSYLRFGRDWSNNLNLDYIKENDVIYIWNDNGFLTSSSIGSASWDAVNLRFNVSSTAIQFSANQVMNGDYLGTVNIDNMDDYPMWTSDNGFAPTHEWVNGAKWDNETKIIRFSSSTHISTNSIPADAYVKNTLAVSFSMPIGYSQKLGNHTLQIGSYWYDPEDIDDWCGVNNWVNYVSEPYRCFSESDQTTWTKDERSIGEELTINESLYINYSQYVDAPSSTETQYTLNSTAIQGQIDGTLYKNFTDSSIYSTDQLFIEHTGDWNDFNLNISSIISHPARLATFRYNDSNYNHNGKYTYLVLHADAFKNKIFRNAAYSVSSAGQVEMDSVGSWITGGVICSISIDVDGSLQEVNNIVDNQNLFYLIPIDNEDHFISYANDQNMTCYKNTISWLVSALSKQQVKVSISSSVSVSVPGIFTDIQDYVVGKIVIEVSPLELGMASLNSEIFYAVDNAEVFITNYSTKGKSFTGNGILSLVFSMASDSGSSTIIIPAILVGENGINLIELNNYSSFSSIYTGMTYIDHFRKLLGEHPQSSWTVDSEPMLYSPAHLKHEWKIDGKQAPILTADMINFERFLTLPWKVIKKLQTNSGSCQWKYELQDIKNKLFPWDDLESHLTAEETRQSPMAIDGQTTAFYGNALSMNQSVYAYSKNNDFSARWVKKQNDMAMAGAVTGAIGGVISGAFGGAAKGAEGGPAGALFGAIGGAVSGTISGITNIAATSLEIENRNEQLALNENIAQSKNAYQNLAIAQAINQTKSIPLAIAPLNVKNTDLIGDKYTGLANTYIEPDIIRETALLRWQHLGYPFGMKAHFTDYDNRVNYNVITVDWLNKEHYIKESIFTWLENNLAQKSLFLFADETCLTLLAKLTGFYRLWHVVPSIDSGIIDAQLRSTNIEKTVTNLIKSGDLNPNGIPTVRPWPIDYKPWWTKSVSLMKVIDLNYLDQLTINQYEYHGFSDKPFMSPSSGDSTSWRTGVAIWQNIGDVQPHSVKAEVINTTYYPFYTTDSSFSNNNIQPHFNFVSSLTVDESTGTAMLSLSVWANLTAFPAVSDNKDAPTDIYGRTIGSFDVKISWSDSYNSSHYTTFSVNVVPSPLEYVPYKELINGQDIASITFSTLVDGDMYNSDPSYFVNFQFKQTPSDSPVTAMNGHTYINSNGWGTHRTVTCLEDANGIQYPVMWATAGAFASQNGKKWQNFLASGNSMWDPDKTVTWDYSDYIILRDKHYHSSFPNLYVTIKPLKEQNIANNKIDASAQLVSVEFGYWSEVPTSSTDGTFVASYATANVTNTTNRDAAPNAPCEVYKTS